MAAESFPAPVIINKVSHAFGRGALKVEILHEVTTTIAGGEIVILTGPSGSGKTTLLTLVGALRATQAGSLQILGRELRGASSRRLVETRRQIGFIFQSHNLHSSLTARHNVGMALGLARRVRGREGRRKIDEILDVVGLSDRKDHYPHQLSGGQKQRVAVARALVAEPRVLLADEPTASLDRESGRTVVELVHDLAKKQGCSVILVTHDHRILDIADRILHMEDGRLTSYATEVMSSSRKMLEAMARTNRSGEILEHLQGLGYEDFATLLGDVTREFEQFLRAIRLSQGEAFESMQEQVLSAFSFKLGELLNAERTTVFIVDRQRGELWSKVIGEDFTIRLKIGAGIAGRVAASGEPLNIIDPYSDPRFDRSFDEQSGFVTRSILALPVLNSDQQVQAVVQLLNKGDSGTFDAQDELRASEFAKEMGVIIESWIAMQEVLPGDPQ